MSRDFGAELDNLTKQLGDLQQLVSQIVNDSSPKISRNQIVDKSSVLIEMNNNELELGEVFYSGQYRGEKWRYRWEPQERRVSQLMDLDGEKVAKVLAALGHKQRLDILRSVLKEPLSGSEIVERLNMGTTGQLYHHIKALLGADLLVQEERGGMYSLASHRALPLLLLLAATSDLLDTSDYMELAETRNNASAYLGNTQDGYDPHHLLWAVLENSILEHRAGFSSEVGIFLQGDGSITVSDNGRGIPVQVLPNTEKSRVQAVLTELSHFTNDSFVAPGGEKGINIAVVNALSQKLSIEVRREGKVFRQDYKHGIPQTGLLTVGVTKETGTSVTFLPDQEIFKSTFDRDIVAKRIPEIFATYPDLTIHFH
ncbi:ATP-binding protein [Paenibacillus sp. Root444D2]|uniref:ATP-binding protein n=1 Tax=Paenibacillus sp. Root444D2 TaxID=1736538 RepID=UPI00070A92D8|nr:ATP-binding protein [Paenibacillus sp. Root444D2]KQX44732.1 ArsR family transcriptional regulator [Paenibacillus sp. Root444D2]